MEMSEEQTLYSRVDDMMAVEAVSLASTIQGEQN